MWQALFAAAVAASTGLLAGKHIFKPAADSDSRNAEPRRSPNNNLAIASASSQPREIDDRLQDGAIFRFSSEAATGRGGGGAGSGLRKRTGSKKKKWVRVEVEKTRRVGVCLKKRKTKGGSSSSKDASLFNWGLNIGIMYMMSAGKSEINKLNSTMDETARIVQELKSELHKRKSSHSLEVSSSPGETNKNYQTSSCKLTQPEQNKSSKGNRGPNDMEISSFPVSEHDGECASSVLTEEREPHEENMGMDQLEAELESELLKLPWCITETPREDGLSNLDEDIVPEVSAQDFHELDRQGLDTKQLHGVLPAQLDQKLCHVLIEQQESQIVELESELNSAQSKLQEKESELQALKDCVRRLTDLSISNVSDDENEPRNGLEQTTDWNCNIDVSMSRKPTVGMKRPIDS